MEINKLIEEIESDFSKGSHEITLFGWKELNQLNEIKDNLEKKDYHCNISHETYINKGSWPYQMTITKSIRLNN